MSRVIYEKALPILLIGLLFAFILPAESVGQYVDPNEPNDSFAQATVFTIPDTFRVDFDPTDDVDIYKFSASQGDTAEITASWRTGHGEYTYLTLELYDSDQTTVWRSSTSNYGPKIQFVFQHDGDYYIKASCNRTGPDYDYSLMVVHSRAGVFYDPYEPNDSFAQATVFTIPDTFRVDFDPTDDVDIYKFFASQGDTVEITASWRTGHGEYTYITLELYDSDQTTVWRSSTSNYAPKIQFVFQHDGDYYIKASCNRTGPDYDYSLNIKGTVHLILPSLSLISPNGGEVWQGLSQYNITWTTGGEGVEKIHHIKLLLSTDSGNSFPQVIVASTPDNGTYEWTVPFINSTVVRVKAQALDASNSVLAQDMSDADFSITSPIASITLTSPNGGEVWQGGTTKNITWNASGDIHHIRILYSTDSGSSYPHVVVENTPNIATYSWQVPTINSSTVRVKLQAMDVSNNILAEDESNSDFSISTEGPQPHTIWTYEASATIQHFDRWEDDFATGDLSGDGIPDVVFGTTDGHVIAVNGNLGTELWKYRIENTTEYVNADIVDVDGDGVLDVVAGGKVTTDNVKIVAVNKDGTLKWSTTGDFPEVTDFAYGDINNDGFSDVVASIGKYTNGGGQVVLFDGRDGSRIWDASLGNGLAFAIDAKDMNSDGDREIAVTNYNNKVFLIDGATNTIEWSRLGGWYGRDVLIGDVDNDGEHEVVSIIGNVYCDSIDGSSQWDITPTIGENLILCDPNMDGKNELLIMDPWAGKTSLVEGASGSVYWTRQEAGAADVGDINGDGFDEIVLVSLKWWEPNFPEQYLRIVDFNNNVLLEEKLDNEPSALVVANIDAYVGDEVLLAVGNKLIALSPTITSVRDRVPVVPDEYWLVQNYPNPFNSMTTIEYELPKASNVRISIFDALGRQVRNIVAAKQRAGYYQITWDGLDDHHLPVTTGLYFCRMEAGNVVKLIKLVLIK